MSITFRIATAADDQPRPKAIINARQLAAFRTLLREEGERTGTVFLDPDDFLSYRFEARVCPLALATLARVFDFETDAITVLEEAQFRSRRISIYRGDEPGSIAMAVALTSDLGLELNLANGNAYALLEGLGLRPDSVGELPIETVRARLTNPAVRRHAAEHGVSHYLDRLDRSSPAPTPTILPGWNGPSLRPDQADEGGRAGPPARPFLVSPKSVLQPKADRARSPQQRVDRELQMRRSCVLVHRVEQFQRLTHQRQSHRSRDCRVILLLHVSHPDARPCRRSRWCARPTTPARWAREPGLVTRRDMRLRF